MEHSFSCDIVAFPETYIEQIVNMCFKLAPNDHFTVNKFGEKHDLRLDIYKDEDYDKERGEYNLVVIHTSRMANGERVYVDDTEDVYVGNGELDLELDRIWHYEDFTLL